MSDDLETAEEWRQYREARPRALRFRWYLLAFLLGLAAAEFYKRHFA